MANILILAAHADDEVLGMGGTIKKHSLSGDQVTLILLADGVGSRNGDSAVENRNLALESSSKELGINKVINLALEDNKLDKYPLLEIVQKVEKSIKGLNPEIVYTHFANDLNIDHRIANQVTLTVFRPVPGSSVKKILAFEVLSSTEWNDPSTEQFVPNVFIDISKYLDSKSAALNHYNEELREYPHTRSLKSISAKEVSRGTSVGLSNSESFMLIREVISE